jgi:hypothetical protein
MTNLARASLALILPALFGAAKSCALVKFSMICPHWSPSRRPTTNQILLLITAISWRLCEHVEGDSRTGSHSGPPQANCSALRTIFIHRSGMRTSRSLRMALSIRGNSASASILPRGPSCPFVAARTRIVSAAAIRLGSCEPARAFKGIICDDVSEFESYMASHAVGLSQVRSPAIVMHSGARLWSLRSDGRSSSPQGRACSLYRPFGLHPIW